MYGRLTVPSSYGRSRHSCTGIPIRCGVAGDSWDEQKCAGGPPRLDARLAAALQDVGAAARKALETKNLRRAARGESD